MKVHFDNYAKNTGKRTENMKNNFEWYRWKVFVNEDDEILNRIETVTYVLHPTFPDPIKVVSNREEKFALDSIGWGEFDLNIKIKFLDGTVKEEKYWLNLSKKWPDKM